VARLVGLQGLGVRVFSWAVVAGILVRWAARVGEAGQRVAFEAASLSGRAYAVAWRGVVAWALSAGICLIWL
jgi:hypothetical protein